jgi:uncharacterized integral membrane protein
MTKVKGILLGVLVAILIFFAIFNSHSVQVSIIGEKVSFPSPLWAVVYASVVIGWIIGLLSRSRGGKNKPQG